MFLFMIRHMAFAIHPWAFIVIIPFVARPIICPFTFMSIIIILLLLSKTVLLVSCWVCVGYLR